MGQRSSDAVVKDAQMVLLKEECARGTGQRSNYAVVKGVRNKSSVEECAGDTGHIVIRTMNLLRLDQNSRGQPQLKFHPICVLQ
jgi:hypothetical protein